MAEEWFLKIEVKFEQLMRDATPTIVQTVNWGGGLIGDRECAHYASLVEMAHAMRAQISQLTYNHWRSQSSYLNSRRRLAFFFLGDVPKFTLSIQYIC